jgi:hypothetical protein
LCSLHLPRTQPSRSKDGLFARFFGKIGRQLEDLTYVEVITAAGDTKTQIDPEADNILSTLNKVSVVARTRIELDGDILEIVPTDQGGEAKINKDIMDIHKENVDAAVQNWTNFMKTILQVVELMSSITGLAKPALFQQLDLSLVPPKSADIVILYL